MISSSKHYSYLSGMLICYTGYFSFCQSVFFRFFQKYKFLPQIAKAGPSFRQSCSYNPYSVLYNASALCASVFMLFLPSIASKAEARWKYRSYIPLLALKIEYDHWKRHRQYHLENHEHNCYSSHGADRNHAIFPVSQWADDERAEKKRVNDITDLFQLEHIHQQSQLDDPLLFAHPITYLPSFVRALRKL